MSRLDNRTYAALAATVACFATAAAAEQPRRLDLVQAAGDNATGTRDAGSSATTSSCPPGTTPVPHRQPRRTTGVAGATGGEATTTDTPALNTTVCVATDADTPSGYTGAPATTTPEAGDGTRSAPGTDVPR